MKFEVVRAVFPGGGGGGGQGAAVVVSPFPFQVRSHGGSLHDTDLITEQTSSLVDIPYTYHSTRYTSLVQCRVDLKGHRDHESGYRLAKPGRSATTTVCRV